MSKSIKYFFLTPTADNLDFIDFGLSYGSISTVGENIQFTGTSRVDSLFVRPGMTYDLTTTGAGSDKVYLTGSLADYTALISGLSLNLTRTVGALTETVKVAIGTTLAHDTLVFADGTVNTFDLADGLANPALMPLPNPVETSLSPAGAAATGATLNATVKAFATGTATAGQVGETFATTQAGIHFIVSGGAGIDTVYVANGEWVDTTLLGGSTDLIYLRGNWADYTKSTLTDGTKLLFTRTVGLTEELVTVSAGTMVSFDRLIFADGAVSTNSAKSAIMLNPTGDITAVTGYDLDTVTPLYKAEEVAMTLAAIQAAAQNNTASTLGLDTYEMAGVKGVTPANLAAIRSALDSDLVNGSLVQTTAQVQTLVNAYTAILASADGTGGNTATPLTGDQYAAVGVTGVSGSTPPAPGAALSLLNDVVDRSVGGAVDSVAALQNLLGAANAVQAQAADSAGLTLAQLGLLGVTGTGGEALTNLPPSLQQAVLNAIASAANNGTATDTVSELQALVNAALPPSALLLADIANGLGGFVINGQVAGDQSGVSVSSAGDVNGDGYDDVIVGASGSDPLGGNEAGRSYVVFGKAGTTVTQLSDIGLGVGGFVIHGETANDLSGHSVSAAGDVNGDGLADLLVGAHGSGASAVNGGRSYVVFGKTDTTAVNLTAVGATTGVGGFVINGESAQDASGYAVSAAGDVNGDGLADVLIGAPGAQGGDIGAGRAYVVFGKTGTAAVNLSAIATSIGMGGFVIDGERVNASGGFSVAGAGDVNGDGLADLVIGAQDSSDPGLTFAGRSYVVFGKAGTTQVKLSDVGAATGTGGFVITGQSINDFSGFNVSGTGDVNGDGLADVVVNSPGGDAGAETDAGRSYVVFGKVGTTQVNLGDIASASGVGTGGFVIYGESAFDYAGRSVSAAGDVNGDGLGDLLVGADISAVSGPFSGRSYVVYGQAGTTAIDLSAVAAGVDGFAINGQSELDFSGGAVAAAGDVNGDGFADLIVGAMGGDPTALDQLDAGRSYVILGGQRFATTVDFMGGSGDDTATGTTTAETFVAGAGNDTLIGNGGADVMYGGMGNDSFVLNASNITALKNVWGAGGNNQQLARVDGGNGLDTIHLSGGANLNLTTIANQGMADAGVSGSRIASIERIDLKTDTAANTLRLQARDVVDMAGMNLLAVDNLSTPRHQLLVLGDALDTVNTGTGWSTTGSVISHEGVGWVVYNHSSVAAQLLIDQTIVNAGHVLI